MKNRNMRWYSMANKRIAYFYTKANLKGLIVSFEYPFRRGKRKYKTINLIGKYLSYGKWHFAISNNNVLQPILSFKLKTHITFTDDGFRVWNDKEKIHTHRRSKVRKLFNEEWRDMLFAFLHGLKDHSGIIQIQLNKEFSLTMEPWTELYWSDFGYYEPKEKYRQDILNDYDKYGIEEGGLIEEDEGPDRGI